MFEKVLLATDLSPAYDHLMECMIELKELGTKELMMVWVVDVGATGLEAAKYRGENLKKLEERGKELKELGIPITYEAPIGIPSHEICRTAEEKGADLIVMGSRGERKVREMFLGSTTSNVIRISKVPVLVERMETDEYQLVCQRKFRNLLLATDFSENAATAEEIALKLASEADKVVIVSVAEADSIRDSNSPAMAKEGKKLRALEDKFYLECDRVEVKLEEGIASENINRIAAQEDVTLIIIGKKGRGGLKELLLGSTAEAVARRSRKPVLLVPQKE